MYCEKEFFELLEKVATIPAPSHEEDLRVEFCLKWLSDNGVRAYADSAKNVVIPFGDVDKEGITVFLGHTDVVFPDKTPLPYVDDGEKIHNPGIGDNTVHAVMLMFMARYLVRNNITPKKGMLLVLNSCEEGLGNLKGIKQIMEDFKGKVARVISFDGQYKSVVKRVVGSERYRIVIRTEGGHSFSAFGNTNAIERASDLVCELYGIEVPKIGDSKTTYNVGGISGGTSVNTIAQNVELLYEYRSDEVKCIEIMREKFNEIIKKRKEAGLDIEVEVIGIRPCASGVDEDELNALAEKCKGICEDVIGISCAYRSSSTDSNVPMSMGIPSITLGGHLGGGAHTREEYIEKASVPFGCEIVKRCVLEFAGE